MVFRGSLSNTSLKRLIVAINFPQFFPISEQAAEELTALLESTTSIEAVEFRNLDAGSGMKRVIKALCNSQTITNVSLCWSRHLAAEIDSMVNQLILSKTNLKVLDMMHVRATEIFYDSVCSVLLRPNSALRALHFDAHSSSGTEKLLCAAAKTQALHTLVISAPTDQAVVEVLSTNIPALKVKTLTIPQRWFTLKQVQDLWNSVKQNFVLQAVKIDSRYEALERPASSYMTRNKNLAEWNEKPVTLPLILWPEALQMSASSTQTAFFSALRNVVQSGEWNSLQGRRS